MSNRPRPRITDAGNRTAARLRSAAQSAGVLTDRLLTRYVNEAALARLFASPFLDGLVLKGGMLMFDAEGVGPAHGRATADVDVHIPDYGGTLERFRDLVREALAEDLGDGVTFDGVEIASVRHGDVPGGALRAWAFVGHGVPRLNLDVTFDSRGQRLGCEDVELAGLLKRTIPVRRVPWACVVADKLQALIRHGAATGRLRDFYDLHVVLTRKAPDAREAGEALVESLAAFGLDLPADAADVPALDDDTAHRLAGAFAAEAAERGLRCTDGLDLPGIVAGIRHAVAPILEAANRLDSCRPMP